MDLNKENMKKMRELIVFTIILLIALWNYKLLFEWIGFAFGIVTPFLIGGGIAFVLNVPMSFFEETLFGNKRVKEKKLAKRLARPLSLVLTIVAVIGVVVLVMFVVIPELAQTVLSLGKTIQAFVPEAQHFLEELFTDNSEIRAWLNNLDVDLDKLLDSVIAFFRNGAGNVLNSTVYAIYRKRCDNICNRVCICMLYFASKRETRRAGKKSDACVFERKMGKKMSESVYTDFQNIF